MNIRELAEHARLKGLDVLGTGDFTHPEWLKELKQTLSFENGIYDHGGTKFILSGEISLIFSQNDKVRKVHLVLLAPDFQVVDQINEFLDKKGRRDYDGRPVFGMSCITLAENLINISKDIMIIPAHAWTPWFAIFGSMSGFNSVEECFRDQAKHIYALETGMSSDPAMNWRLSKLDNYSLVSFSDSHSLAKIGREFCAFDVNADYRHITDAMKTRKGFLFTGETPPDFGKYHFDGHRNCNISLSPADAKKIGNICPVCKRQLTIGVMHRIEELADRPDGYRPKDALDFKTLVPLEELIAAVYGTAAFSKKVQEACGHLMQAGSELDILLNTEKKEIEKLTDEKIAAAVMLNRAGKIKVIPGYDGVYGRPIIFDNDNTGNNIAKKNEKSQKVLSDF
jgi:uncharacterized protein (TIGR00375 family)